MHSKLRTLMDNQIQVTDNACIYFQKGGVQTSRVIGTEHYEGKEQDSYLPLANVTKSWRLNLNCRANESYGVRKPKEKNLVTQGLLG